MNAHMLQSAVFLDRDGTLNEDRGYVTSVQEFVLLPGVCEGIVRLNQLGMLVIVVTNQSAIGRGFMTEGDLAQIHEYFAGILKGSGAHIDKWLICPHRPEDGCDCRKPKPGMILQAVKEFHLDVTRCYLIGDKASDLSAAESGGVAGILVKTSSYASEALTDYEKGTLAISFVAETFLDGVDWITQQKT